MAQNLALELGNVDLLKHALFHDYVMSHDFSQINTTQERILMTVKYSSELPMVTIARAIGLEKGPFSQSVDRLENLDLLQRVRSAEDKRLIYLKLTATGETLTQKIEDNIESHFKTRVAGLSTQELSDLFSALATIQKTVQLLTSK